MIGLVCLVVAGSLLRFAPVSNSVTDNYQKVQEAHTIGDQRTKAAAMINLGKELPWRGELLASGGKTAFLAGDLELALSAFQEADQRSLLSPLDRLVWGDVFLASGMPAEAERTWLELTEVSAAHQRLAALYEDRGDFSAAVAQWQEWEKKYTGEIPVEIHYQLGRLLSAEDPQEALPHLQSAAAAYPEAAILAEALQEHQDEEIAYLYMVSGQALGNLGHWRYAVAAFEQAVHLRPDYLEAWAYLGEGLQHLPEPESDPLEALQQAQNLQADSPLVNMFLGLYWQRKGSHITAVDYFQKAALAWPDQPDVYVEIGRSLAAVGELDKALENYQKAVDLAPETGLYYSRLAAFCAAYSYQVKELGLPSARTAIRLSRENPEVLTVMGEVLLSLQDEQNAWQFFHRAVEIDPTYAPAHFQLAILYAAKGEDDHAVYHVERVFERSDNPALTARAERLNATLSR